MHKKISPKKSKKNNLATLYFSMQAVHKMEDKQLLKIHKKCWVKYFTCIMDYSWQGLVAANSLGANMGNLMCWAHTTIHVHSFRIQNWYLAGFV